jgi:hypothetical protein
MHGQTESKPLTAGEAVGCLGFALGLVCVIIGFALLTTAPDAVHRWVHADGYRPTEVVVSPHRRQRGATVQIVSTGEVVRTTNSPMVNGERAEGPHTMLYNPQAVSRVFGMIGLDNRIIGDLDRDLRHDALLFTFGVIAFFSAGAWLLTAEKLPVTDAMTRQRRRLRERRARKARNRAGTG